MTLRSILFVQDDCEVGAMWAGLLRQKGMNIVFADMGQDFSEQLQDQAFDLIVVNICSMRTQGIEACHQLRNIFLKFRLFL